MEENEGKVITDSASDKQNRRSGEVVCYNLYEGGKHASFAYPAETRHQAPGICKRFV